jgi:hypothetical protein
MWAQSDGVDVGVWSSLYTREAGWGVPELVQPNATFQDVAINASGVAVAIWTQSDAIQETVWSSRYKPEIGWDVAEPVSVAFWGPGSPKVGIDDEGNAVALWEQGGSTPGLWANRYTPGSGWGEPELVSAESKGFALGVDPDGDATAVWESASGRPGTWANRYE